MKENDTTRAIEKLIVAMIEEYGDLFASVVAGTTLKDEALQIGVKAGVLLAEAIVDEAALIEASIIEHLSRKGRTGQSLAAKVERGRPCA